MAEQGKILVVDDDRLVLATVAHGLAQAGYEVIDADNGDDAILLARQHKPDLALLDIRMEGMSGFDVAAYLRDHLRIPFMFLSAFADDETLQKVKALGAVAYLVKPLDISQILPTVAAAINGLQARAAAPAAAPQPAPATESALDPVPLAVGVLMHRYSLQRATALERLRRMAADEQRSLAEQAGRLVDAVELLARGQALTGSTPSAWGVPPRGHTWSAVLQTEMKAGALAHRAVGPDVAAMAAHDALHRGQAHARALEVAAAVQPLEHAEQPVGKAHVEARAVVADHIAGPAVLHLGLEAQHRLRHLGAVLPGIAQQVLQRHAQQRGVALGHHPRGDVHADLALGLGAAQVIDHEAGQP